MYGEWWIGPVSGDAAETSGWRRPFRRTHAAPSDAFLMAQPVVHECIKKYCSVLHHAFDEICRGNHHYEIFIYSYVI